MNPRLRLLLLFCSCLLGMAGVSRAQDQGPSEDDTAIHVPTPPDIVSKMLEMARVNKNDLLYDLGCGDGRIVIAAAAEYGCRAIGYDIDPRKVRQSNQHVKRRGVESLVQIECRDIFELDLSKATVITLYLLPEMNEQLIPQLQQLKPGSRIVAHEFAIAGIAHDRLVTIKSKGDDVPRDIYLYTVPLRKELEEGASR